MRLSSTKVAKEVTLRWLIVTIIIIKLHNLTIRINLSTPYLETRAKNPSVFATMDIETITFNGHQLPCLISIRLTSQVKVFRIKKIRS